MNSLSRERLIEIGQEIVHASRTEEEINVLVELFNENVPHPNGANLFFYPENYSSRKVDLSKYYPTVEEIVDQCLRYSPIQL